MAEHFRNSTKHETPAQKELLAHFFSQAKTSFNRCLAPGMECTNRAIKAHSIQNATVLDLLARDGHVKMIVRDAKKESLTIDFGDVGRNEAYTFAGFCSNHDSSLFAPIDNFAFNPKNEEQLFLIAYRAVARELYACMDGAIKLQTGYQKRVELGFDTGKEPEEAGVMALERMLSSHAIFCYKADLEEALALKNYSYLRHSIFTVSHDSPCFAVSGFFDLFAENVRGERSRIALNVFPLSKKESVTVFSYTDEDSPQTKRYLDHLLAASGDFQKYLLSKLVLMHCENFVVSPNHFDKWPSARTNAICKFYVETLHYDKEIEDANLYLF